MRPIQKGIFTLNIDNFEPEITALTFPFIRGYADKIGAEMYVIAERQYPHMPTCYEKLQIFDLIEELQLDWAIYIDADALVHPDMFDVTDHLHKDTVMHYGRDMAGVRWSYDHYFRRDGRHIGSGNWFTAASDWCRDLWAPHLDLTFEQAVANIHPAQHELNWKLEPDHLLDDYLLSRNIAKYGLKFMNMNDIMLKAGIQHASLLWHQYGISAEMKRENMIKELDKWNKAGTGPDPFGQSPRMVRLMPVEAPVAAEPVKT